MLGYDLNMDYIQVKRRGGEMKPSDSIIPISYLKAHVSEIIRNISNNHKTMVITQNGEAKAILQDVSVYEETQESLALLKMLTMSKKNMKDGRFKPIEESFNDLKNKIKESRNQ